MSHAVPRSGYRKPLPKGRIQRYVLQALQYNGPSTVDDLTAAFAADEADAESGLDTARKEPSTLQPTKAQRNSVDRAAKSLVEGDADYGPWVTVDKSQGPPYLYSLIPPPDPADTTSHSLMDGLIRFIDQAIESEADRDRLNRVAKKGSFASVVEMVANLTNLSEREIRFEIAQASDKKHQRFIDQFEDDSWARFGNTPVPELHDEPLVPRRKRLSAVGIISSAIAAVVTAILLLWPEQPNQIIQTADDGLAPNPTVPNDPPAPIEAPVDQLAITEDAVGVVPSNGDFTIAWDGPGGASGTQPVFASLVSENTIRSISGRLTLNPGDAPIEGQPGGVFVHVYSLPGIGRDGGKDAQIGLLNTADGPVVDGATGICTTTACYGTGSNYANSGNATSIDASEGLDFSFSHQSGTLSIEITSVAEPEIGVMVASADFAPGVHAVSLDIWGTEWPFVASLTDVEIVYEP